MSIPIMIQVLGWLAVLWLFAIQMLTTRSVLPRDGRAFRAAGAIAALTVAVTSVATGSWPVAVLGMLWLRTEVFGHRFPADTPARRLRAPAHVSAAARSSAPAGTRPPARRPELQWSLPHWGPRVVNVLFDIEMVVVVVIAVVLFGIWAQQQHNGFSQRANASLCSLMGGC